MPASRNKRQSKANAPYPDTSLDDVVPFTPLDTPSHARKRQPGHIPRPANAFMIFRSTVHKELQVSQDQRSLSQRAGDFWRKLSEDEKDKYRAMYRATKRAHAARYPGYKYRPRQSGGTSSSKKNYKNVKKLKDEDDYEVKPSIKSRRSGKANKRYSVRRPAALRAAQRDAEATSQPLKLEAASPDIKLEVDSPKLKIKAEPSDAVLPARFKKLGLVSSRAACHSLDIEGEDQAGSDDEEEDELEDEDECVPVFVPTDDIPALSLPPLRFPSGFTASWAPTSTDDVFPSTVLHNFTESDFGFATQRAATLNEIGPLEPVFTGESYHASPEAYTPSPLMTGYTSAEASAMPLPGSPTCSAVTDASISSEREHFGMEEYASSEAEEELVAAQLMNDYMNLDEFD